MKRLHLAQAHEGALELSGEPFHYLARVLRVKPGDKLEVFDGRGHAFDAAVTQVSEQSLSLSLSAPRPAPAAPPLTLIQGLPKGDKLELVLQKGTELGVAAFWPVVTRARRLAPEGRRGEGAALAQNRRRGSAAVWAGRRAFGGSARTARRRAGARSRRAPFCWCWTRRRRRCACRTR